ncbi:MAG: hypothetical protein OJF47_000345 [Nitrospira sp.]|nr:MAG: hypothetical protein OJF47_000345 [Nitrospira sp.]
MPEGQDALPESRNHPSIRTLLREAEQKAEHAAVTLAR